MELTEKIQEAVFAAIDDFNASRERPLAKSEETIVFGVESQLESLALVTLLTAIEEHLEEQQLGDLSLMDVLPIDAPAVTVAGLVQLIADSRSASHT